MEGIELICFQIITEVGSARSLYIEAIQDAKKGQLVSAHLKMKAGQALFVKGHQCHANLIQQEADDNQQNVPISLLLMHAEDQLMNADAFKIVAEEFIELYERLAKN